VPALLTVLALVHALCLALVAVLSAGCDGDDSRRASTPTSTSTTSSTTTTSTTAITTQVSTTTSTSSTTVPAGECVDDSDCFHSGIDCYCSFNTCHCAASRAEMELELVSDVPVGALQLEIGYAGLDDYFVGAGALVECDSLVAQFGAFHAFNDHEGLEVVSAAFISLTGIGGTGALGLMRCALHVGGDLPTAGDFAIVVTDASDVDLAPLDPPPLVEISRIELSGGGFPLR
jgi:hypothetical protein